MTISTVLSTLALALGFAGFALAQDGQPVNDSQGPPYVSYSTILKYSGSNVIATCVARSQQPAATFSVSGSTPFVLTSIGVATNVGTATTVSDHGLNIGDKIVVSGGTADPDINATYAIATVPTTKTFTITTVAVSDGTYNNAALQFATNSPRSTQPIWSITKFTIVSSNVTAVKWANGTSAPNQICDNSATLPSQ